MPILPWLALLFPIVAWGLSFPSIKAALVEFPPMTLACGRFILAAVFLSLVQRFSRRNRPSRKFAARDKWSLGASVLTGITLYFLCENHGVKLIPATAASLIVAGIPILTLLADRVFGGRRMGVVGVTASVTSLAGAALLVGMPNSGATSGNAWGYALMLGAALAWVMYLFAMKPLQEKFPNLQVTAWQMALGAVSLAPFALAEIQDWRWPSILGWGHLIFQGLVCSAASYLLYNHALEKLGRSTASLAVNLIPVVTAVASFFLLGEVLAPWQWLGGALVIGAVLAVGIKESRTEATPETASPAPTRD